jgi:hypothetical protein
MHSKTKKSAGSASVANNLRSKMLKKRGSGVDKSAPGDEPKKVGDRCCCRWCQRGGIV